MTDVPQVTINLPTTTKIGDSRMIQTEPLPSLPKNTTTSTTKIMMILTTLTMMMIWTLIKTSHQDKQTPIEKMLGKATQSRPLLRGLMLISLKRKVKIGASKTKT